LHILHAIEAIGEMQVSMSVSVEDNEITDDHRLNAITVMCWITDLVLLHVDGWVQTKVNPELVTNPMKRANWLLENGDVALAKDWLQIIIKGHYDLNIVAEARTKLESIA